VIFIIWLMSWQKTWGSKAFSQIGPPPQRIMPIATDYKFILIKTFKNPARFLAGFFGMNFVVQI